MRMRLNDMTPRRVYDAFKRRVRDMPSCAAWHVGGHIVRENRAMIEALRNRHRGERCFVIANGPSLSRMDLTPLKREFPISTNRDYLLWEEWGFTPTYYCSVNELVLRQFSSDIAKLPTIKFINWSCRKDFLKKDNRTIFLRLGMTLQDTFQPDLSRTVCSGGTVTYVCLQLAYFLGFQEVVLVGLDHSFVEKGTPNATERRTSEVDRSHCHPDYFPKGTKWQLPDLYRSEIAYSIARNAFEADNRKILDATLDGRCEVFEKVSFASCMQEERQAHG